MKNSFRKIFSILLLASSIIYLAYVVAFNRNIFLEKFDAKLYEKKYYQSQWVIPNSKNPISDEELFAYAGYRYIKGENPILINPETPPLGKYLMGTSILLFGNYRILAVLFAFFSLVLAAWVTWQITQSHLASSIAFFLTSIHSLFTDQIVHSGQHDIYQLVFLLLFIIFFILFLEKKHPLLFFFSGVSFGAFISIKVFLLYYLLFNGWLVLFFLLQIKAKKIKPLFGLITLGALNIIALISFTATYFQYFFHGGTLRGFLGVQKWIALFYEASTIDRMKLLGNYLSLVLFNRWRFWSPGYPIISYERWSLFWPVIFIVGLFSLVKLTLQKARLKNILLLLLASFFMVYNGFLFIIPVFPRYLLLLFMPLHIFIAVYLSEAKIPILSFLRSR